MELAHAPPENQMPFDAFWKVFRLASRSIAGTRQISSQVIPLAQVIGVLHRSLANSVVLASPAADGGTIAAPVGA